MKYFCGRSCLFVSKLQLCPQKFFMKRPQSIFRTPVVAWVLLPVITKTRFFNFVGEWDVPLKGPLNGLLSSKALQNWS